MHEEKSSKIVIRNFLDTMRRAKLFQNEFGYIDILYLSDNNQIHQSNFLLSSEGDVEEIKAFYSKLNLCMNFNISSSTFKSDLVNYLNPQIIVYVSQNDHKKKEIIEFSEFVNYKFIDLSDLLYLADSSCSEYLIDYIISHLKLQKTKNLLLFINTKTFDYNYRFLIEVLISQINLIFFEKNIHDLHNLMEIIKDIKYIGVDSDFDEIKQIFFNQFKFKITVYDQIVPTDFIHQLTSSNFLYFDCKDLKESVKQNIINQQVDPSEKSIPI